MLLHIFPSAGCFSGFNDSVSTWRPLVDVVETSPFAVCDVRTMSPSDLLELEVISTNHVRRSFLAKYSEKFRFYYLSRMKREEVCVFKVFDSDMKGPSE